MADDFINNGGAAFPVVQQKTDYGDILVYPESGMSLRQWYAGLALMGNLSAGVKFYGELDHAGLAEHCFRTADAMIAAGEK